MEELSQCSTSGASENINYFRKKTNEPMYNLAALIIVIFSLLKSSYINISQYVCKYAIQIWLCIIVRGYV